MLATFRQLALTMLILTCLFSAAQAGRWYDEATPGVFGVKGGIIGQGSAKGHIHSGEHAGHVDFDTKIGKSAQVFFDIPLFGDTYVTTGFDYHDFKILNEHQWLIVAGLGVKHSVFVKQFGIDLRPSAVIGWGHAAQRLMVDATDYLTTTLAIELYSPIDRKKGWLFELAWFRAPLGGNDEMDATLGPMLILRAGLAFR